MMFPPLRRLFSVAVASLAVAALVGCDDGVDAEVSANVDGTPFVATSALASYSEHARNYDSGNRPERTSVAFDDVSGKFQFFAEGADDPDDNGDLRLREIVLTVSGVTGPGTYELVRNDDTIQQFQLAVTDRLHPTPHYYGAPRSAKSLGTLTISQLGDGVAEGTFRFICPPASPDAGYAPVKVTDGRFRVPLNGA